MMDLYNLPYIVVVSNTLAIILVLRLWKGTGKLENIIKELRTSNYDKCCEITELQKELKIKNLLLAEYENSFICNRLK